MHVKVQWNRENHKLSSQNMWFNINKVFSIVFGTFQIDIFKNMFNSNSNSNLMMLFYAFFILLIEFSLYIIDVIYEHIESLH